MDKMLQNQKHHSQHHLVSRTSQDWIAVQAKSKLRILTKLLNQIQMTTAKNSDYCICNDIMIKNYFLKQILPQSLEETWMLIRTEADSQIFNEAEAHLRYLRRCLCIHWQLWDLLVSMLNHLITNPGTESCKVIQIHGYWTSCRWTVQYGSLAENHKCDCFGSFATTEINHEHAVENISKIISITAKMTHRAGLERATVSYSLSDLPGAR